jgi:hypothetical protein
MAPAPGRPPPRRRNASRLIGKALSRSRFRGRRSVLAPPECDAAMPRCRISRGAGKDETGFVGAHDGLHAIPQLPRDHRTWATWVLTVSRTGATPGRSRCWCGRAPSARRPPARAGSRAQHGRRAPGTSCRGARNDRAGGGSRPVRRRRRPRPPPRIAVSSSSAGTSLRQRPEAPARGAWMTLQAEGREDDVVIGVTWLVLQARSGVRSRWSRTHLHLPCRNELAQRPVQTREEAEQREGARRCPSSR